VAIKQVEFYEKLSKDYGERITELLRETTNPNSLFFNAFNTPSENSGNKKKKK
jgi:hypothetical protein